MGAPDGVMLTPRIENLKWHPFGVGQFFHVTQTRFHHLHHSPGCTNVCLINCRMSWRCVSNDGFVTLLVINYGSMNVIDSINQSMNGLIYHWCRPMSRKWWCGSLVRVYERCWCNRWAHGAPIQAADVVSPECHLKRFRHPSTSAPLAVAVGWKAGMKVTTHQIQLYSKSWRQFVTLSFVVNLDWVYANCTAVQDDHELVKWK